MDKIAATPEELLRWLLGSAAVGATARLGLATANQEFGKRDPLKPESDLYDPSIDIPIKMSPAQHKKYLELKARAGGPDKLASWDNSVAAATMVGGSALGWHVVNKLIERQRKRQLAKELQGVRDELTGLTLGTPPENKKVAAIWEMLDRASDHHLQARGVKVAGKVDYGVRLAKLFARRGAKSKTGQQIEASLKKMRKLIEANPARALAVGGTAGLVGLSALPGTRELVNKAGEGVAGGAGTAAKGVLSPLGHGAAAVLGPIATLGLLYGLSKGYTQLSSQNPRKLELAAMRRRIREEESHATPYFELRPEVVESQVPARRRGRVVEPELGTRYSDVDAARDAAA